MSERKTIGVLTSGGDAPGMNAALRAVVRIGINSGMRVKGIRRGYSGLLADDIFEFDNAGVMRVIDRGGTILHTARCEEIRKLEGQKQAIEVCKKEGIDVLIVIGGDGTFRAAGDLAKLGLKVIGIPATIDNDIGCSDYTIGFDTACNTAMEAIDKIRDTSMSHERISIVEVMGRHAGYIALYCGFSNGAEEILLPEKYDGDKEKMYQRLERHLLESKKSGRKHHLIINAEGIGESDEMAKRLEATTGIETRATKLGHLQRGGSPSSNDRYVASIMGVKAVKCVLFGRFNRLIVSKEGQFTDIDLVEGLAMKKEIPEDVYKISKLLLRE